MGQLRTLKAKAQGATTCVICGNLVPFGKQYLQTCGDLACQLVAFFHPKYIDPTRSQYGRKKPKTHLKVRGPVLKKLWTTEESLTERIKSKAEEINKSLELTEEGWLIRGTYEMAQDERGEARPEAQKKLWSVLSRRAVFIRAISAHASTPSLVIHRRRGQSTIEAIQDQYIGDSKHYSLCDTFYAWGCSCDNRHKVEYTTIEDLPNEDGYHDACPLCGSSPIEVITDA